MRVLPNAYINTIGSGLLSACDGIETLRSKKTNFHGKMNDDYFIKDPLFAYFVVNSVTSVGLFLNSFYRRKFPKVIPIDQTENDPFELPF
ncbi:MAG TPA: hypothetical protein DCL77_05280 [Prolixibacteraceae bacterium]|jgi:hypothetical protein|nr:hypothetical protein [Prolixibacteraceae bacterium]